MFDDLFEQDGEENPGGGGLSPPEDDRLLPPRENRLSIGHTQIRRTLDQIFSDSRRAPPHALIFSGPSGVGKATMAFSLARYLLQQGQQGDSENQTSGFAEFQLACDDPLFRKVASGGHPDLKTVERQKDSTGQKLKSGVEINEIRKVAPFLRHTASREGGWRVVIIDDADTMNRNAQNALLKILEEPPAHTLLILIAHRVGALIPTIRSRCRTVLFKRLDETDILALLQKEAVDELPGDLEKLALMAEGSIGRALSYLRHEGIETLRVTVQILENWPDYDWPRIHILGDKLARPTESESYACFEALFLWLVRSLLFARAREAGGEEEDEGRGEAAMPVPPSFPFADAQALERLFLHYSLEEWSEICEKLQAHFTKMSIANLDRRQSVIGAFDILSRKI